MTAMTDLATLAAASGLSEPDVRFWLPRLPAGLDDAAIAGKLRQIAAIREGGAFDAADQAKASTVRVVGAITRRSGERAVRVALVICGECGETKPHVGRGLCGRCYHIARQSGTLDRWPTARRKKGKVR